jgi:hypothetical protein
MPQVATGVTQFGDSWQLDAEAHAERVGLTVTVTSPDGFRFGGGTGDAELRPGQLISISISTGNAERGSRRWLAVVGADVRAVVVTLSDGSREDLILYATPLLRDCRMAVLIYDRRLDIHRVDLLDAEGTELARQP